MKFTKMKKPAVKVGTILAILAIIAIEPAAAQTTDNFICDGPLEDILSNIMLIIVYVGGAVALIGGAGYTVADAARPGQDYEDDRRDAILYGAGSLILIYFLNALLGAVNENLSFDCILPFVDDGGSGGSSN